MPSPNSAANTTQRYLDVVLNGLRSGLDVMMMVLGSAWLGMAIAIFLAGFGLVGELPELSTGAMLVTVLVLGLMGAFGLGIASEGSMRCAHRLLSYDPIVVLLVRGLILAGFSLLLGLLTAPIERRVNELPGMIGEGVSVMNAVARAGLVAALLGSLLAWFLHRFNQARSFPGLGTALIFLVWSIATMFFYS